MPVYYMLRSHYDLPSCKHVERFEVDSLVDWFRLVWDRPPEMMSIPGLSRFLDRFPVSARPQSWEEVNDLLRTSYQVEVYDAEPSHVQILHSDEGSRMDAFNLITEEGVGELTNRAAFMLTEGWHLPGEIGEEGYRNEHPTVLGPSGSEGELYLCFDVYYGNRAHHRNNAYRIPGLRLGGLASYLAREEPGGYWPEEPVLLRLAVLDEESARSSDELGFFKTIREDPEDEVNWQVYHDWLEEHDDPPPGQTLLALALKRVADYPLLLLIGEQAFRDQESNLADERERFRRIMDGIDPARLRHDPSKCMTQVEEHVAQLFLHTDVEEGRDCYHRWFLFDDLWAAAHPRMADEIIRHVDYWDVLQ